MMKRTRKQIEIFEEDSNEFFSFIAGYTEGRVPFGVTWEEMISQELKLRPAVKTDAKIAAELIHIAIDDIAEQLTGKTESKSIRDSLSHFFQQERTRLSFQNTIVSDVLGEVVGIVVMYPGESASQLDEPILKSLRKKRNNPDIFLDKEADEGDFYIDTICVSANYRGYGIGTALIKEAERVGCEKGYHRISLNVAHDNLCVKKLYLSLGYSKEKVIQINGHNYDYMVKKMM